MLPWLFWKVSGALRPADDAETFDRSPYGALSMGGNVAEWTNDFYSENRVMSAGMENPQGPLSGTTRTVKGGSAADAQFESGWLLAGRFGVEGANPQSFGFRCAVSAGEVDGEKVFGLPDPIERSATTLFLIAPKATERMLNNEKEKFIRST